MDQASLQRMLKGERDMSLSEAVQLSVLLDISFSEVVSNTLGLELSDSSLEQETNELKIFGITNCDHKVH